MILIRFFLYIIILLSSSLIGYSLGSKYSKRVINLVNLQQSIRLLQSEVIVFANPIPIALENISRRVSPEIQQVYSIIEESLVENQTGDLYSCFLQSIEFLKNTCLLKDRDIDVFLALGKVLGKTDRTDQELQFKYALNEFELLIVEAKDERIKNEKMYRSLGVLMGLGMIIILI